MRVQFRETGGFAGLSRGCDLDADKLSGDDKSELVSLVKDSKPLLAKTSPNQQVRDALAYEIVIEEGKDRLDAAFDDTTLPKGILPLLDFLKKKSRPIPL